MSLTTFESTSSSSLYESDVVSVEEPGGGGYWRVASRPTSPGGSGMNDGGSEASSMLPRPKSRPDQSAKYNNLSYWRARKLVFYKNGDPFFPGLEFRFKPGRDVGSLDAILDKLSLRLDLPHGARYIFSMDGERKTRLEELEDGNSYVVSSYKTFKLIVLSWLQGRPPSRATSDHIGYSLGLSLLSFRLFMSMNDLRPDGPALCPETLKQAKSPSQENPVSHAIFTHLDLSGLFLQNASYGKKNGTWTSGQSSMPQSQGWAKPSLSRKQSLVEADMPPPGGGKPSSGRVIRIVNNLDHTVQCRVLLNLRTTQPFEEVLEDLGQVLKMNGAKRMYTVSGQEVRSFSQLRNEFADVDTFYLGTGHYRQYERGFSPRRSRSRAALSDELRDPPSRSLSRTRSKSQPRIYDPDGIRGNDYTLLEVMKEEPARVTIRGMKRTFYPPIHHAPQDNSPPDKRLALSWVYGYRGVDSRKNLWVLPSGELLYYVAAVAVLYDRDEDSQRHYVGHTEDIQCMELHPSREMVASGQRAGRNRKTQAHIRIWSTETLLTLYVFGMGEFDVGVSAVAFSQLNGGSYVLAVDAGRERILSVWQWQWGHLLGKVATLQDDLTGAVFHPLDDNLLITHGKGNLTFWIRRKDGFFERTDIIKPPSRTQVTSVQFEQDGDVITADSDGFITIYSVDADGAYFVRMEFEAHNKGISSIIMLSEGTLLSGGERDRKIIAWDSLHNYKKVTETKLPETFGGVRSLYPQRPGRNDGNIYVGTTRNNIVEGSLQRRFNQVVFGHGRQLWGLAVHPDDELFATAGHDKNIALWRRNKLIWTIQVQYECVSLSFHPFGSILATGSTEGHLIILNAENGALITTIRVCGSPLSCLSYNPAGDVIAIGSHNGSIYLFRVSRDGFSYKKSNKIRGSQQLTQLDWSSDGNFLQTTTSDYDLLYWDVKALIAEKSPITMKDVKWYTQTCSVGFTVSGIWNNRYYPMSSLIVTSNRSSAHDLLITGDSDGYLRLFRYPCLSPKAEYTEEKVYSLQVACARFLFNDKNVVSVGGTDAALMLWEVIDE
ncbi:hypothetical protein RUM44_006302 [Polyplax serrata]|uniref:Doublecortin domain-containing protein n=1 Tax=Polyplax serrata TaxID=468196 RepID=A0ABR1AJ92_POLSC